MEFTLYYRGPLKANRGTKEKHELRRLFHNQLKELWSQVPLSEFTDLLKPPQKEGDLSVLKQVGNFVFAPLVSEKAALVAELDITLLRPEPPGSIIIQSGDIDNRLKTLLDALKVPNHPNALPDNETQREDEKPFFCLLEDDSLITKVSVSTDRLLDPVQEPSEVVLLIHVKTKQLQVMVATIGMA
jgi:hypothetical protein